MIKASALLAAAIAAWVGCTSAHAAGLSNRVWVSGHGVDQAGCGPPTAPCRSLQYAHDHAVAAGGEIDILDPAGYGAIAITKSVSIVNDGVGTAGVQASSGDAITINAPGGAVYLRGLNIDGEQGAGTNGVQIVSGASLTMVDCVIRHFSSYGFQVAQTTGPLTLLVYNSIASANGYGFVFAGSGNPAVRGVFDHVLANDNTSSGVYLGGLDQTTGANFAIVNSDVSNNGSGVTVEANAGNVNVNIDSTVIDMNSNSGLSADGGAIVHLSRSVIDENGTVGVFNDNAIFSSGDNHIEGNASGALSGGTLLPDPLM